MNQEFDSLYNKDEQKLLKVYRDHSQEMPSSDVSKIILAAAHRECLKEQKKSRPFQLKTTFWDRLRIPISMAGAMVMTITLAHVMWPMIEIRDSQIPRVPVESSAPLAVEYQDVVFQAEESEGDVTLKPQKQSRTSEKMIRSASIINVDAFYDMPSYETTSSVASQGLADEREQWVKRIVKLAQDGNYQSMNQELKAFVAEHPDFPIDNLIRPYIK